MFGLQGGFALKIGGAIVGVGLLWVVVAAQVSTQLSTDMSANLASIVPHAKVTQLFGCTSVPLEPYDPRCPGRHFHTGVDLAAPVGTPVYSASSGIAHVSDDPAGAGLFVEVTYGRHVRVLYCHLAEVSVRSGQLVQPGQPIGLVGATGRATGPHLHFEVQIDGRPVDPVAWLRGG